MKSHSLVRLGITLPIVVLLSPPALRADTRIKVSTTADDITVNGNCTLREAIIAANTDAAVDRCPAGTGADAIILPAGTYLLSLTGPNEDAAQSGDLDIVGATFIFGAGAVIDGGSYGGDEWFLSDRVLHVLGGGELSLSGTTIRGGVCWNGAGILNAGALRIDSSSIQDNLQTPDALCGETTTGGGAGIFSQGTLTVTRSVIRRNDISRDFGSESGGGLLNSGAAQIADSVIASNWAAAGGGIENLGELHVTNTEISHNAGRFYGAGLRNQHTGTAYLTHVTVSGNSDGGILNGGQGLGQPGGTLIIRNSTMSNNASFRIPGSIINWGGVVEIISSTIADNPGGGLGGQAPMTLRNTLVANPGYGDCENAIVSLGRNLDSDGSCGLTGPGDLPNTDPRLGPLADNGGPTLTHALLPDSPAINRIPPAECAVATDQRGVARPEPKRGACDVGAYEFSPAGDVLLIDQDVQALTYRPLTPAQVLALRLSLKDAYKAASSGDPASACLALAAFTATVSDYVSGGIMSTEALPLLDAAHRVQGLLCS
jgi:CSLREA domain-containing protein